MKSNSVQSPKMILTRAGTGSSSTGSISYTSTYNIFYIDISFTGTLTLTHTPMHNTERVVFEGVILTPGTSEDYTLTGKIISFNRTDFIVSDKITVFYNYSNI